MTQNKNETNEIKPSVKPGGIPALKLNMMDRFYLAVTKRARNNLVFVYTLGCAGKNFRYDMDATIDVAAFDNETMANIYYQTILELIEYEKESHFSQTYEILVDFNDGLMKNFNNNKRGK